MTMIVLGHYHIFKQMSSWYASQLSTQIPLIMLKTRFVNFIKCKLITYVTLLQWIPEITYFCPKTPFLLVGLKVNFSMQKETAKLRKKM